MPRWSTETVVFLFQGANRKQSSFARSSERIVSAILRPRTLL
jgi:hypothetical protein